MSVRIDIDSHGRVFVISDPGRVIQSNRRISSYFSSYLDATFEDDVVKIPVPAEEGMGGRIDTIRKEFEKHKIEYIKTKNIEATLSAHFKEEENFKAFSEKAKGIWRNDLDVDEFRKFEDVVDAKTHGRLYRLQKLAAFHLAFAHNACNFSVPGAGKTSIVYGAYAYLKSLPEGNPSRVNKLLVIGPLSSFAPWEDEYQACFGVKAKSKRLSGNVPPRERERHLCSIESADKTAELTLMSYQGVSYDRDNLNSFLSKNDNKVMVVLDEAHRIKRADGEWAKSVLALATLPSVKSRVVLTGTPAPNGYEDIYNLYEFIWPGKDIIGFHIYHLKDMSKNPYDKKIEKLIDNIAPFFIRIKKKNLNLPLPQHDSPIFVPMSHTQREIYNHIEEKYVDYFENDSDVSGAVAKLKKARMIRLMQAATNPSLLRQPLGKYFAEQELGNEIHIDDRDIIGKIFNYGGLEAVPSKYEKIKDVVVNLTSKGEKVILWGVFIKSIKQLQGYLGDNGIRSELLIGEVPVERDDLPEDVITREKIIRDFHKPNCPFKVLIANPFAVAESISLHKACHHAIYFERTFNAAQFIQSKDRIHRVGLKPNDTVRYSYIISENSIEETIHSRLEEKETRMLKLLEEHEIPLISENMDDDVDVDNDVRAIIDDYHRRTVKV